MSPNRNKQYELENIDDFIESFNTTNDLGKLKRISDENQENPDAILLFNGKLKIALEATIAFAPGYRPHETLPEGGIYNPDPAISEVLQRIESKSLADYKSDDIDESWLLISGGAYISDHHLGSRLKEITRNNFDRVFIHKGTGVGIIEIYEIN